jgi:hypothetical protein
MGFWWVLCVSCLSGIIELDYPWSVLFYVMISFSAINSNLRALYLSHSCIPTRTNGET